MYHEFVTQPYCCITVGEIKIKTRPPDYAQILQAKSVKIPCFLVVHFILLIYESVVV